MAGKKAIGVFDNSDGDRPMPQWTAAGEVARFLAIVHHAGEDLICPLGT